MRTVNTRIPLKKLLSPYKPFYEIYKARDLLLQLTRRNIQVRFKGSLLGTLWTFVTPVCMLAIYTFIFSIIFRARWGGDAEQSKTAFALIIFCGMAVLNIFSESVSSAVYSVTGNPSYVKKVVFPLELIPVSSVFTGLYMGVIWLAILLLGIIVFTYKLHLASICLPLVLFPLLLCSCGFAWIVASLGVFFRDLSHIVGILLQMLFFLTPIFYTVEMIPARYQFIFRFNLLAGIVTNIRRILIFGKWPDWYELGLLTICSWIIFQAGYMWFMKTKRGFADVL